MTKTATPRLAPATRTLSHEQARTEHANARVCLEDVWIERYRTAGAGTTVDAAKEVLAGEYAMCCDEGPGAAQIDKSKPVLRRCRARLGDPGAAPGPQWSCQARGR